MGKEITGKKCNEIFKNIPLYKFTNTEEKHYDHQYVNGLNFDANNFDISRECSRGGLYFTSAKYIGTWIDGNTYVRNVSIPDDARVCIYQNKIKANKIILGPRNIIYDSDIFEDEEMQILAVQQNGYIIKYIKEPSEEVKKLAVKQNGIAIKYIDNSSEELQRLAVQQNGNSIKYIDEPSEEVQMLAVQQNGNAIMHIKEPSEEVQKLAVQQNGRVIQDINEPSEEVKMLAVQENGNVIIYIKEPSEEVQRLAVQQNGNAIMYIKEPSEEVQRLAVEQNFYAIKHIKNKKVTNCAFFSFIYFLDFFQLI
jgi:hypothetical protein